MRHSLAKRPLNLLLYSTYPTRSIMRDWTKLEDLKEPESGTQQIPVVREIVKYVDKPSRKITEIRIFFDDGTFEVFSK